MPSGAREQRNRRADYGRRVRAAGAVRWAVAGGILGAGLWICLDARELVSSALQPPAAGWNAPEDASGCTSLTLDRHSGNTRASPCPARALRDTLTAQLDSPHLP